MIERVRRKAESKSKSAALASARWKLFDQPYLLEGEDAAAYQELLTRIRTAIKPVDTIEEMFISDIGALEWEVLRWRRLKLGLIRELGIRALGAFLRNNLNYDLYRDDFENDLTEVLEENLPEGQEKDVARTLAYQCAQNEPEAVEKVKRVLAAIGRDLDKFLEDVRDEKVDELMQKYAQRKPDSITRVNELLAVAGTSIDVLVINALVFREKLSDIERIDRLTTIAESRRNASLREIDRRRAILGETLRWTAQKDEVALIEAMPAKGDKAA
jgi:hypothetical protein